MIAASRRSKSKNTRPVLKKASSDKTVDCSEADFVNFCRQLEENDPDVDTVTLGEAALTPLKAIQLGSSLEGNTHVCKLVIDFSHVKVFCGAIFGFIKYIENSNSLHNVVLVNADLSDLKVSSTLLVLLPGVAKNKGITSFEMRSGETVYRNIFVALWYTIMHALFGGSKTSALLQSSVAHSLGQCQSIENLVLAYLPEAFNCQLLPELSQFHALTSLTFIPRDYSMDTLNAMSSLVRSSMTLETLQLEGFQFNSNNFSSLAEGLVETMAVKELSLSNCSFKSSATQMLEDVATTMTNLTIGTNMNFSRPTAKVMASIVSQTEESRLKVLDLAACPMPGKHLTRFLDEAEDNGALVLERLSLPSATTPAQIAAIKGVALRMPNLKELRIARIDVDIQMQKELVEDLKQNLSLMKCIFNGEEIIMNRLKEKSFSFQTNRTNSQRRLKNLHKTLSSREIKDINDKEAHLERKVAMKLAKILPSDSESESQAKTHQEKMMETMSRHNLSGRVLDILKDEDQ